MFDADKGRMFLTGFVLFIWVCAIVALVLLSGCAGNGFELEVETPDKNVQMKTDYQIENGLKVYRNPQTGELEVELGSATTKDAEMGVVVELIRMMQAMWMQSMGVPVPPPEPTEQE